MHEDRVKAGGLATILNTIAAPKDAFETLRRSPTWGWAFLVTAVLYVVSYLLMLPATHHVGVAVVQHLIATNPRVGSLSDAQKQTMLQSAAAPGAVRDLGNAAFGIVVILIAALCNTVLMLLANAVGGGDGTFKTLWCGSMNVLVPSFGIAQIVLAIVVLIRGPEAFGSFSELARALPGLGAFTPGSSGFAAGFFASISVFAIWGLILNALMVRTVGRASAVVSWTFAIVISLLQACSLGATSIFGG